MKLKILILIMSFLIFSPVNGEEKKIETAISADPDSFTPESAVMFLKIKKISRSIDFLNLNIEYFNSGKTFQNSKWLRILKEKANIDLLNTKSLQENGIDVDGSLYLADMEIEKGKYDTILFIPVTDKKNFSYNVVKLLKETSDNKTDINLNPAISSYKGFRIFQISSKIFFTQIDDYFTLTSSGNLLSEIIDLKLNEKTTSLYLNPIYKKYTANPGINTGSNIFNVFITKNFLERTKSAVMELKDKKNNKVQGKTQRQNGNNPGNGNNPENPAETNEDDNTGQISNLNFVDFLSISLSAESAGMSLNLMLSVNKTDYFGKFFLETVTAGLFDKALYIDNPTAYYFISIDFNKIYKYLNNLALTDPDIKKTLSKLTRSKKTEAILKEAALPCSRSFINVVFKSPDSTGAMDNFIVYIPMKDCGKIDETLKKIKEALKKKYNQEGAFGEEKINGFNSFYFINDNNDKFSIAEYKGDLYAGNNADLIGKVINTSGKNYSNIQKDFIKKIDKNTFLLSYIQFNDESFLKVILMMLTFNKNPELFSFINKIENITFFGKKIDNNIIFDLNLKMISSE